MNGIYRIIILLCIVSIGACAPGQSSLIAGDDEDRDIGIGGTGMLADNANGLGGTGIVGVITGFGSIFVNGVEIEYNNETPFSINGEKVSPQQLAIGDVVEVLTTDISNYTFAQAINLRHEIIGEVESVNTENASFIIHGQTIVQPVNNTLPQPGSTLAVAGFRINEHTVQATGIRTAQKGQSLIRRHTDLPFSNNASQWLIQTHVQNNNVQLRVNGTSHALLLNAALTEFSAGESGIRILELQISEGGELILNQVIDTRKLPRGQITPAAPVRPDRHIIQRQIPVQMNKQHRNR